MKKKMVLIESVNEKYFLIAFQNELYIYDLSSSQEYVLLSSYFYQLFFFLLYFSTFLYYKLNHTNQITVAKYLPKKNLLIYSDITKDVYIDDLSSKTNIAKKFVFFFSNFCRAYFFIII